METSITMSRLEIERMKKISMDRDDTNTTTASCVDDLDYSFKDCIDKLVISNFSGAFYA